MLIDLRPLVSAGWLPSEALEDAPPSSARLDHEAVVAFKRPRLAEAHAGFRSHASTSDREAFDAFRSEHGVRWLDDFALFTALFEHHSTPWHEWPAPLRDREPRALLEARDELSMALERITFEQWLFRAQWGRLRHEANSRGIELIGDIPIFVSHNSAEVWANREIFELDAHGRREVVAGVPPDYFSETGQRWGNPLYDWSVLAERGFDWWIERVRHTLSMVDRVRIDHFRGFVAYWEIPASAPTAVEGRWRPGPGRALFDALDAALGGRERLPIIAEDLGEIDAPVYALRDALGLPGMRVLHFAFLGGDAHDTHLPHEHVPNAVVYTGTHDNNTTVGWYRELEERQRDHARQYLSIDGRDIAWQLLTAAWRSVANSALAPAQDILSLGTDARMNTPGVAEGNWDWRLRPGQLRPEHADRLRALTRRYGRSRITDRWR